MHGRYKDPICERSEGLLNHLSLRLSEHGLVQRVATTKTDEIKSFPAASSEKVEGFVGLSRILLRVSHADAEVLFSSAIELAKEIDWERCTRLRYFVL